MYKVLLMIKHRSFDVLNLFDFCVFFVVDFCGREVTMDYLSR